MEEDYVKEAHENFSLLEFLTSEKKKESAVIVISPNQLINCKTTGNGKGNHAPMFSYIADRILPGKIGEYLKNRDDVCEENELLIAGRILDDECIKCTITSDNYFGNVLAWYFPKNGTLNKTQCELLSNFLNNNREAIERTKTKMGIVGKGEAITINGLIEEAKSVVDSEKKVPELFADEDIIGFVPEIEKDDRLEDEQK